MGILIVSIGIKRKVESSRGEKWGQPLEQRSSALFSVLSWEGFKGQTCLRKKKNFIRIQSDTFVQLQSHCKRTLQGIICTFYQ